MASGLKAFRAKLLAFLSLLAAVLALAWLYLYVFVWPSNLRAVVYFEEARDIDRSTAVVVAGEGPRAGRVRQVRRRSDLGRLEVARIERDTFLPLVSAVGGTAASRVLDWRLEVGDDRQAVVTAWVAGEALETGGAAGLLSARRHAVASAGRVPAPRLEGAPLPLPRTGGGEGVGKPPRMDVPPPSPSPLPQAGEGESGGTAGVPVRVFTGCGQNHAGTARRDGDRRDDARWEVTVTFAAYPGVDVDPCVAPVAIEPAAASRWMNVEEVRYDGAGLELFVRVPSPPAATPAGAQVTPAATPAGAQVTPAASPTGAQVPAAFTAEVRDAAGGDLERLTLQRSPLEPDLFTGRLPWADRALTPSALHNGRLEVRPPVPVYTFYPDAKLEQVALCVYPVWRGWEGTFPRLGATAILARPATGPCPQSGTDTASVSVRRGASRTFMLPDQRVVFTFHDAPRGAVQEVELEVDPLTAGVLSGAAQEGYRFVPAATRARVSSQFGLRPSAIELTPAHGGLFVAQELDPELERGTLVIGGAQQYKEDLASVWALLADPGAVHDSAPANRLEAFVMSSAGILRQTHQLTTDAGRLAEVLGSRLEAIDLAQARVLAGKLEETLTRTNTLLERADTLTGPLTPKTTAALAEMVLELRDMTRDIAPLTRALAAKDVDALEPDAPLLARELVESAARLDGLLERAGQAFERAGALGGRLEAAFDGPDAAALLKEGRLLVEQLRRTMRETEVLEYRMRHTWPLKSKPDPPPVTVPDAGALGQPVGPQP